MTSDLVPRKHPCLSQPHQPPFSTPLNQLHPTLHLPPLHAQIQQATAGRREILLPLMLPDPLLPALLIQPLLMTHHLGGDFEDQLEMWGQSESRPPPQLQGLVSSRRLLDCPQWP